MGLLHSLDKLWLTKSPSGKTPLQYAASAGIIHKLPARILANLTAEELTQDRGTLLHAVLEKECLHKLTPKVFTKDILLFERSQFSEQLFATGDSKYTFGACPVIRSLVKNGLTAKVPEKVMEECLATPNEEGETPLHEATGKWLKYIPEQFLTQEALSLKDAKGNTVFRHACWAGIWTLEHIPVSSITLTMLTDRGSGPTYGISNLNYIANEGGYGMDWLKTIDRTILRAIPASHWYSEGALATLRGRSDLGTGIYPIHGSNSNAVYRGLPVGINMPEAAKPLIDAEDPTWWDQNQAELLGASNHLDTLTVAKEAVGLDLF